MANQARSAKKRLNWRGFSLQLFLLTILPLTLLLLGVVIGSQMLHHDAMRSLVVDRDRRAVEAAATALTADLSSRVELLALASSALDGAAALPEWVHTSALQDAFDGGINIFSPDGSLEYASPGAPGWLRSPSDPIQPGQPAVSVYAPGNGEPAFFLVQVRAASGQTIVGAFSIEKAAADTLAGLTGSGQTAVWVLQQPGPQTPYDILYSNQRFSAASGSLPEGLAAALENRESGSFYTANRTGERLVVYSPVLGGRLWLVAEEAWEDIASPYLSTTQSAPLILIPVFLMALVALWFGARRVIQPLQALEQQAVRLGSGDFQAVGIPVGGIEEIRSLQNELAGMAEKLKNAQLNQRSYIAAITSSVENERRNLARELHDDAIQSLIALNQRIQLSLMNASGQYRQALVELQQMVSETMLGLRRLIRGLRPIYLEDLGLTASLKMLAQETGQAAGLPIAFELAGSEQRLEPQVEMSLYRMVQESLNNACRHAAAHRLQVRLSFAESHLEIEVCDDGKGFAVPPDPSSFSKKGHFGLLGLQERAELLGAHLAITSAPGHGTRVHIRLDDLPRLALEPALERTPANNER